MTAPTPIRGMVTLEQSDEGGFRASVSIPTDDPIFDGHYPDFPIYPGVCLIEAAHRAVLADAGYHGRDVVLTEVENSRFLHPVFPGDRLIIAGQRTEHRYRLTVRVRRDGDIADAARIRLRYRGGVE